MPGSTSRPSTGQLGFILTYGGSILLGSCSQRSSLTEMVLLNNRNRMREDGIHPDVFTFTAFVQLYANDGEFGLAKEAFERIRDHGVFYTFHAVLGGELCFECLRLFWLGFASFRSNRISMRIVR